MRNFYLLIYIFSGFLFRQSTLSVVTTKFSKVADGSGKKLAMPQRWCIFLTNLELLELVIDWVPGMSRKMGLNQVEQGRIFFLAYLMILK